MLANIKERARRTGEKKGDDIGRECVNCGNVMAWRRTHAGGEGVTDRGANARVRRKTGDYRCFAWNGRATTLLFRPNAPVRSLALFKAAADKRGHHRPRVDSNSREKTNFAPEYAISC